MRWLANPVSMLLAKSAQAGARNSGGGCPSEDSVGAFPTKRSLVINRLMKLKDITEGGLNFDEMLKNKDADPRKKDEEAMKAKHAEQAQRLRSAQRKNKSKSK